MNQTSAITQEMRDKINNGLFLDHTPSDQQIIDFLKSIDGKEEHRYEILIKAQNYFINQRNWIETKSQQDDLKVSLMTIKRDLGL